MKTNLSGFTVAKLFNVGLLALFFLFFPLFFKTNAFASENFSTSYNVVYDVKDNEITRVTLNIGLTNKTTDYYAASYSVQAGFDNIKNIFVTDASGTLDYKTEKNDNGTKISFEFNDKTVGIGNTQKFSISFDTDEISKNYGSVWEVNIPGIANQDEYSVFNVEVLTPKSFGNPTIIKPKVDNLKSKENSISFNKFDLGKGGISIAYGDYQAYQFNLKYHISNKNVFPELTEIAIPSDNSYQKVSIDRIDPEPENVIIDQDGNWLARYKLLPSQNLAITVTGKAKIFYTPKSGELSLQDKNTYTKQQKYWETNDPEIQKIAKELKTPKAIYDYVVKTLKYDTKRIGGTQVRAGALAVLQNPDSAVCLEFTDLFVTLARAAGIPARAVEGYANTTNTAYRPLSLVEDVLHAWPEYWDENKKTWIMVDPTWGNTTKGIDYFNVLDFDHFAFAIKGSESDYPIPAGGYKSKSSKEQKDVHVATLESYTDENPSLTVTTDFPKRFYGGLPITGNLIVSNNSKVITPPQNFKVEVENLNPKSQDLFADKIPPHGKKVIPIKFSHVSLLTNQTYTVKISIGSQVIEKEIIVLPIYKSVYFAYFLGGILSGAIILIISFVIYRSRRLHFPK